MSLCQNRASNTRSGMEECLHAVLNTLPWACASCGVIQYYLRTGKALTNPELDSSPVKCEAVPPSSQIGEHALCMIVVLST
eukprot:2317670-Amphidinium_carterae.2